MSLSERKPDYVAPRFLISLTALYDLAGAAGGIAGFMFNGTQTLRRRRDGIAAQLSTRDVWTEVVAFRATTPNVIAILEHCSYQGFFQCATSGASDAYIYIVQPHFLPLGSGKKPDYRKIVSLQVDRILLRKDEIIALLFLDEEGDMG